MKQPKYRGGVVPPGGYCRYKDPDAGFIVQHPYWEWCKSFAYAERVKRGLPIPYNWDAMFDAGFCEATPQACMEVPDAPIETGPNFIALAAQFATSVARWVLSGAPVATWEEFKARHVQCTGDETHPRCPRFTTFAGTGVTKCGACGCSSLKLWMKTEHCPINKW